ncbi:hypothetical protein KCU73_g4910, partial [Aureobasidium melanogenum]
MLNQAAHTRVVIDALDESRQQRDTLEWLRRTSANQSIAPNKLNVIITSRREYDIESAFLKWISEENVLSIRADDVNKDIGGFVHSQIQLDPRLERWKEHPDVQIEIKSKLIEKANGMFRWVTCQLDTLENCLDLKDLRNALDDLPDGLNETYSRILARVDARNHEKATAMLQLLIWGLGELTLNQFVDALAIRRGEGGLYYDPGNKMPVPTEIVKILPGLVILDAEYLTSDCVHETFKPSLEKLNAHIAISDMCIAQFYSSHLDSHLLSDLENSEETDSRTRGLPYFIEYSVCWAEHARIAQTDKSALERIFKLLTTGLHPSSPCTRCMQLTDKKYFAIPRGEIGDMSALFFASLCGLDRVVSRLLEYDAQTIDDTYTYVSAFRLTALGAATYNCHEETVRVLLVNGATPIMDTPPIAWGDDTNAGDPNETATALRILRMLLEYGAEPTFVAVAYALQPLENIRLVKFLLDNGAPMADNNKPHTIEFLRNTTLLHVACEDVGAEVDTVRMILDHGAEIDALDEAQRTALDLASSDVKKLLLDRGADVTASRYEGCTPLHGAVRYESQEKTVSLLDSGADIDAQNERGETALHIAALSVRTSASWFVEELLSRGADALIKDQSGSSALDALGGRTCPYGETEDEECKSRVRSMLSKAMSEQSRSAEAVSRT